MFERTNRNLLAKNTIVQLLALYTDPESHISQCYRDRQTDDMIMPIADHTVYNRLKTVDQVRTDSFVVRHGVTVRSISESLSRCACYVILPVSAGARRSDGPRERTVAKWAFCQRRRASPMQPSTVCIASQYAVSGRDCFARRCEGRRL